MPRRRGGKQFKIRQALAIASGKVAQKRGNNRLLINTLLSQTQKQTALMSSSKARIISNEEFTGTIYLIDVNSPTLIRCVGAKNQVVNTSDNSSTCASEASTLIVEQMEVEVITID